MPRHTHYKLYKPYGYISQMLSNDAKQAKRKKFLSDIYKFPEGTMAIGRLDEHSEGLLLLTTDGKLSDTVNRSGIEKEYYAQVDGTITEKALIVLKEGVSITVNGSDYITKYCNVRQLTEEPNLPLRAKKIRDSRHGPTSWISITITEGKFRQIRKMTSAVGFPTLRLVRIRIGSQTINDLEPSQVLKIQKVL